MTSVPQLEAEPRGATAQLSLVGGDPLSDYSNKRNSWQNIVTVTSASSYDKTTRYPITPQHSNINPHSTSFNIDHGNNPNLSRQTSVSHLSNESYGGNPSTSATNINNNFDPAIKNCPISTTKINQQPLYSPYPTTSIASTAIHNPQREVKIKTPSGRSDDKERSRSIHSTHSSGHPFSSNNSKTSKSSLTSNPSKRNRLQDMLHFCKRNQNFFCCIFCILFIIAIIVTVILCAILIPQYQTVFNFQWAPPIGVRGSGMLEGTSIRLTIDDSNEQARFDMTGHVPFKGNYVSVYDFKTRKVIIYDPSLKNGTKTLYCFVMSFGNDKIKDISELRKGAHNSQSLTSQTTGWEEQWHYLPQNVNNILQLSYVNPGIVECNGARLVELKSVGTNQKNLKCTDCFDFCFPEYGIETDLIQSQSKLNIANRLCFYFFVPEWQSFAQGYNTNNINPNLNNPQFSSYQYNGNIQNIPYSTNPSIDGNYGNGLFVGYPQNTLFNGNQNGQRMMGQRYSGNSQIGTNLQSFSAQQQRFYNGNGQSNNYNNGMNRGPIVTSQYTDLNNPQNGLYNQYNSQQNGQTNVVTKDNNSHPESKWISVNPNNGLIDQISNATSNIWTGAKETFNTDVDKAQNVQETLGRGIQNIGSGIESVGSGFQRFGSNIETGISNMRQTVSSGIDNAGQALQNLGQNARTNMQTFGQNIEQGINEGVDNLQNEATNIHQQLRAQFNQLKQQNSVGPQYNNQPSDINTQNNLHYLVKSQLSGQNPQNNGNQLTNSQFEYPPQSLNNFNNENKNLSPGMAQYSQSNYNLKNPMAGY